MRTIYLLAFFVLSLVIKLTAKTIYVGKDQKYKSIKSALQKAKGGDIVLLMDSIHREENVIDNLSFKKTVTIKSSGNHNTILCGTIPLAVTWQEHATNIYKAKVKSKVWQLFRNEKMCIPARWPNATMENLSIFNQRLWAKPNHYKKEKNGLLIDSDLQKLEIKKVKDAMAILNHGSFKSYARKINFLSVNSFSYNPIPAHEYRTNHQQYYYLEGSLGLLDSQNEWYYNNEESLLYVYTQNKEKLASDTFYSKTQSYALIFNHCRNIQLENISFFATTIKLSSSTHFKISSCIFSYPSCSKRMLGSEDLQEITHIENDKLLEEDNHILIERCLFEHSDGGALRLKGNGIKINNNHFRNIDWSACAHFSLGASICGLGSKNCSYTHNTIHKTGGSCVILPGKSSTCKYNKIYDYGLLQSDGAAIQCTRHDVDGAEISYNWIYFAPKHYAIRFDAPPDDILVAGKNGKIHHNVIWNTKGMMVKGNNQLIYNNTMLTNNGKGIIIPSKSGSNSNTRTYNNLVERMSAHRSKYNKIPGIEGSNWNGYIFKKKVEALIEDKSSLDFSPKSTSIEIIDKGINFEGYSSDVETKDKPDIGAYEYGGHYWKAGANWSIDL